MKRLPFVLFVSGLTVILSVGVFWTAAAQAKSTKTFTLEVACDGMTAGANFSNAFNPPTDESAFGPRGTIIIVNGNIYPEDGLPSDETAFDLDNPGKIGTWRCHFAALGNDSPLIGAVTYYFQLDPTGKDSEDSMIIVQGLNSHRPFGSVERVLAVVGGTGRYAGATGEVVEQVAPGFNDSGCFNLRFHFRIRGVKKTKHRDDDDD